MILNKGLKKTYVQNSHCYYNRIHPSNTFSVLVPAQGDFGDIEAAKQITAVCGQSINLEKVCAFHTAFKAQKDGTFKGTQNRYLAQQADKVSRCDLR